MAPLPARCKGCGKRVFLQVEKDQGGQPNRFGRNGRHRLGLRWCEADGFAHECSGSERACDTMSMAPALRKQPGTVPTPVAPGGEMRNPSESPS